MSKIFFFGIFLGLFEGMFLDLGRAPRRLTRSSIETMVLRAHGAILARNMGLNWCFLGETQAERTSRISNSNGKDVGVGSFPSDRLRPPRGLVEHVIDDHATLFSNLLRKNPECGLSKFKKRSLLDPVRNP